MGGGGGARCRPRGGGPGRGRPPTLARGPPRCVPAPRPRPTARSAGPAAPGHGRARHLGIVEGQHLGAHDLAALVTLAGDDQHVVGSEILDRGVDRPAAVAALAGFVFLHEPLRPRSWLAIGLVVVASAGAARKVKPPVPPDA